MSKIYKEIIIAKDNSQIPILKNSCAMHSKYSPQKESQNFGNEIKPGADFTIIIGLGGGYHIQSFITRNPSQKVLVIEESDEDINYLSLIECNKKLLQNSDISIIAKNKISSTLPVLYLPAIYGGINILANRAWADFNKESYKSIITTINETLKKISQDYSVQCHFGYIWQKNILLNLKLLSSNFFPKIKLVPEKTAAIIAAGPSLDFNLEKLSRLRNKYFILATDTGFSVLVKNKIIPDAVISIDGQNISYRHFSGTVKKEINFIFDLQGNFNAIRQIVKMQSNLIFTKSSHPFCEYAQNFCKKGIFQELENGAGTVTIAAIDFAQKAGFSKFEVYGADFSYINNKPYAKGTYLDALYRENENRLFPAENNFTNILYRTEIHKTKNQIKTQVLEHYKQSFLEWIEKHNLEYTIKNHIYYINSKSANSINKKEFFMQEFDWLAFKNSLIKLNESIQDKSLRELRALPELTALLPFVAWLRNKNPKLSYSDLVKLALSKILEYT